MQSARNVAALFRLRQQTVMSYVNRCRITPRRRRRRCNPAQRRAACSSRHETPVEVCHGMESAPEVAQEEDWRMQRDIFRLFKRPARTLSWRREVESTRGSSMREDRVCTAAAGRYGRRVRPAQAVERRETRQLPLARARRHAGCRVVRGACSNAVRMCACANPCEVRIQPVVFSYRSNMPTGAANALCCPFEECRRYPQDASARRGLDKRTRL